MNTGLGDLGSVRGRIVLSQEPGNPWKCFFGPRQQATLQNVGDVALGVLFDSRGHKAEGTFRSL